jgi:hypothetical protein
MVKYPSPNRQTSVEIVDPDRPTKVVRTGDPLSLLDLYMSMCPKYILFAPVGWKPLALILCGKIFLLFMT